MMSRFILWTVVYLFCLGGGWCGERVPIGWFGIGWMIGWGLVTGPNVGIWD